MPDNARQAGLKNIITEFLQNRMEEKLAKAEAGKKEEIRAKFQVDVWLADAARRAGQLSVVTHTLKATHPDAKGTSLYWPPKDRPGGEDLIGTHTLAGDFAADVVGNAAALDVYRFLRLEYEGRTLLDWLEAGDPDALAALSPDQAQSEAWARVFGGLKKPDPARLSSHTLAKQVYWLTGEDPLEDAHFHLLAPLYASSLAQDVYLRIQEDRFGEAAKNARQARKDHAWHEGEARDYPDLALRKLGGTKPQNISQLNAERHGVNYLLPSLPPIWQSRSVRPPRGASLFKDFERRRETARLLRDFKKFLDSDPPSNRATRDTRNEFLTWIIDEFKAYAEELRTLPPGWTRESACRLPQEEKDWLEPEHASPEERDDEPTEGLVKRFGNWLNSHLNRDLPLGEVEQVFWSAALGQALKEEEYGRPA
ncbi:type I-F CRISPR-associated protein Csy1 [Deltaproteobacteria bacterium]|nr:type I-F CRISPR-associated protein Csy1 [Deltaproteobacteria bacterium]